MRVSVAKQRERRVRRVRRHIRGTNTRPRLAVFRSNKHVLAQLIDDETGRTVLAVSDLSVKAPGTKTEKAVVVGKQIAAKSIKKGIRKVVFDRRHYKFHGRVAALARAAREAGLEL